MKLLLIAQFLVDGILVALLVAGFYRQPYAQPVFLTVVTFYFIVLFIGYSKIGIDKLRNRWSYLPWSIKSYSVQLLTGLIITSFILGWFYSAIALIGIACLIAPIFREVKY